jgi:type III secretion system HrpE/YscL family protein
VVQGQAPRSGPPKVIQSELVSAAQEARRITNEAEEEAQRIREQAEADADEFKQRGYQEGYEEGLGQYTEKVAAALLQVQNSMNDIEPQYVRLVRACVEKILGQELKLHPDAIVGIVRNALVDARQQREIIVRVHPDDVDQLKKNQGRLLEKLARASAIEIRADAAVTRGGCIVVTELGTIDATLQRQLEAIETALNQEMREGDPNAPMTEESIDSEEEEAFDDVQDEEM